jgi:hypothetical protein
MTARRFLGIAVLVLAACGDDGSGTADDATDSGSAGTADDGDGGPTGDGGPADGGPADGADDDGDDDGADDGVDDTGDDPTPSAGCGVSPDAFANLTVIDAGTSRYGGTAAGRAYEVDIHPVVLGTDANAIPRPLIFGIHGCGETIENSRTSLFRFLDLTAADPGRAAIFVYPKSEGECWDNASTSADHAYLEAVYAQVHADLCIDTDAIFFAGQSSGGYETHSLPMWPIFGERPGRTAGIAVNAAGLPYGTALPAPDSVEPAPAFAIHGTFDPIVPVDSGRAARDFWIAANGCGSSPVSLDPLPTGCIPGGEGQFACECSAYLDCTSGAPVHWCEHAWDIHYIPDWGAQAMLDFFFARLD